MNVVASLQDRFGIRGVAEILAGQGGLPMVRVTTPAATAEVYLHGAQVTAWQPTGAAEVLFLSRESRFEEGRAIRGGIPICFPWFRNLAENPDAPQHGLVRTAAWELDQVEQGEDGVTLAFSITKREADRRWWMQPYHVEHRVTIGAELRLALTVSNTGSDPMRFEEALHTYFRVGDATQVHVLGLDGATYLDNTAGNKEKLQAGEIRFSGPTDSAYANTEEALELLDPSLARRLRTDKVNSRSTVVWNPWRDGAAALRDLLDDEWQQMTCVEAANLRGSAVVLAPGERHTMTVTLSVAGLQPGAR